MNRFSFVRFTAILMIVAMPFAAFGADSVGKARGGGNSVDWNISGHGYAGVDVIVVAPNGDVTTKSFKNNPSIRLQDLGSDIEDGAYQYEVRLVPNVSSDVAKKLEKARASNDHAAAKRIMKDAGLSSVTQSGTFTILNGAIVNTELSEDSGPASSLRDDSAAPQIGVSPTKPGKVSVMAQVIPDDLIVQGSECVGIDCSATESFGFDTIRMKENNLRLKAEDTSSSAGYPSTDWQLTFNDSASGGANKFSVEDMTAVTVPFTLTGAAPTNSIFVANTGRVGFRTATPGLDLHVSTADTPAIRLEQTAGGFTAQTWDIGANEANFFVRDLTGGSRLSFRIRPGAPTSSIDIAGDGDVGIGTASPEVKLDVEKDDAGKAVARFTNLSATGFSGFEFFDSDTTTQGLFLGLDNANNNTRMNSVNNFPMVFLTNSNERVRIDSDGDVGINCNNPTSDLVIATTAAGCTGSVSSINAGSAQFTVSSSRSLKQNLEPVEVDVLSKIEKVGVYNYDFIEGPKDRLGLMAEDFHQVFGRGSDKVIDGNEVQMALWLAVQQLTAQNKELTERLAKIEEAKAQQQ